MGSDGDKPTMAPHLVNEELRLPGSFRHLCESVTYTDEEIGRIVRCLALGTDAFLTPRIEPDVAYYSNILAKRLYAKERKRKSRKAKSQSGQQPGQSSNATEKGVSETDSPAVQATPVDQVPPEILAEPEKPSEPENQVTPIEPEVIVPETKSAQVVRPVFIEQQIAARPKAKGSRAAEKLSGDLFSLMDEPDKPRRVKSTDNSGTAIDSRNDSAWIENFAIFWKQYPRKVAKEAAKKAFISIIKKQSDVEAFMAMTLASLKWWKEQDGWKKDQGKFIPHPATWLNRGSWGDFKDNVDSQIQAKAEFLRGDAESDEDLIKRMKGG